MTLRSSHSRHNQSRKKTVKRKNKTRSCPLCNKRGSHTKYNCDMLTKNDQNEDGVVYGYKSKKLREKLVNEINATNCFIKNRPFEDKRVVLQSWPTKLKVHGLQIHNKYKIITDNDFETNDIANICLECTILVEGGQKDKDYTKVLMKAFLVTSHIITSQNHLISTWL